MMSDPLQNSESNAGHGYEFGEYDGLVDLDALLLHRTGTSPTPDQSCLGGSGTAADYTAYVGLSSQQQQGIAAGGVMPSPKARSPAHRQQQQQRNPPPHANGSTSTDSHYPAVHASNTSAQLHSHGAYPMMDDFESPTVSATPRRDTSSGGGRKRTDSAAAATTTATNTSNNRSSSGAAAASDDQGGIHLPAIVSSQRRKPTEPSLAGRTRVSGKGPEGPVPRNTRSPTAGVSPSLSSDRPPAAKTVVSAHNLAALQRSNNNNSNTNSDARSVGNNTAGGAADRLRLGHDVGGPKMIGSSSTGVSSSKIAPPYLAPPLTPLNTGGAAYTRPVTDGSVKRGKSANTTQQQQQQQEEQSPLPSQRSVEVTSPKSRTNGWVKAEARRIDSRDQDSSTAGGAVFPPERVRANNHNHHNNTSVDGGAAGDASALHDTVRASADRDSSYGNGAARVQTNTSPAVTSQRPHVWTHDYDTVDTVQNSVADFGAMPKLVVAPPGQPRAKKYPATSSPADPTSNGKKATVPLRPPPPPAAAGASPGLPRKSSVPSIESAVSALRGVANTRASLAEQPAATAARPVSVATNAGAQTRATATDNVVPVLPPEEALNPLPTRPMSHNTNASGNSHDKASTSVNTTKTGDATSVPRSPSMSHRRIMNAVDTHSSAVSADTVTSYNKGAAASAPPVLHLPYTDERRAALEAWAALPVLDVTVRGQPISPAQQRREQDMLAARPTAMHQLYQAVRGQAPQEFAGEPFEMNYDVHNVVVQLRHRNRPLMMAYPARLPLDMDTRPRLRRQRTPRSFYGKRFPQVGDIWFRGALDDARLVKSPNIESMEKREEEEFIRNGGDPAQRRNRYGQSNNNHQRQQQQQQPGPPGQQAAVAAGGAAGSPTIEQINRNAKRMEQPAS